MRIHLASVSDKLKTQGGSTKVLPGFVNFHQMRADFFFFFKLDQSIILTMFRLDFFKNENFEMEAQGR